MPTIETLHLFDVEITVPEIQDIGDTPYGVRRVAQITGGTFEGERLRGRVLAGGGDWLLLRKDGVLNLDVRLNLETEDGAKIFMTYHGFRHGPEDVIARLNRGEDVDPGEYYFRTAPRFETAAEKYAWLNSIVCVATGLRKATGPVYEVFEVL
jgi:hypothetical protein